jgi:hypothetical protein
MDSAKKMHMTDHHLIAMNLQIRPDKMPLHKGRHLKKADWEEFSCLIDILLAEYQEPILWSANKVDLVTQTLRDARDKSLDVVAPTTPYRPKNSIFSWWTPELLELKKSSRRAHNYARCRPGDDDRCQDYRAKRRLLKKESLKARKTSW